MFDLRLRRGDLWWLARVPVLGLLLLCDGTTKGARSRRFFHLRLHDLDMEGSVNAYYVLLSAVVSACLQGAKSSLPCDLKERCMLSPRTIIQRVETRGWSYALPGVSNK